MKCSIPCLTTDSTGRRTRRDDADGSRLNYGYDAYDQLTSAVRAGSPNAAADAAYKYQYQYDEVGNRLHEDRGLLDLDGTFNPLNQLTALKFGGKLNVVGSVRGSKRAKRPFRVMIDGEDVTVFNEMNPATDGASFHGGAKIKPGTNTISIVSTDAAGNRDMSVRHVTFPPTNPQAFQYDANGNQLSDGLRNYTWDEENRLTSVESASSVDKKIRVVFAYDGMSRRVSKKVYSWNSDSWLLTSDSCFTYDGWNLIAEVGRRPPAAPSTHRIAGQLNLNPNNSPQNEFVLTLTNGSTITRDNLTKDFLGYSGPARSIHLKAKGNGKQDGLLVDGVPYEIDHARAYDLASEDMTVHFYNDQVDRKGRAMGHWWIEIEATGATITVADEEHSTLTTSHFTNFYVWGLDLSGTLQGAGGVEKTRVRSTPYTKN